MKLTVIMVLLREFKIDFVNASNVFINMLIFKDLMTIMNILTLNKIDNPYAGIAF